MQTSEQRAETIDDGDEGDAPDVATALCHEIHQPLSCLLASLDRAHEALRRCAAAGAAQEALRVAHCLADAHATARHLSRVVGDVHGHTRAEPRRTRRLDLRATLRAAAAMVQPSDGDGAITIDAPEPAWVDGVDTRLVHVFVALFADALTAERPLLVRVRASAVQIVV